MARSELKIRNALPSIEVGLSRKYSDRSERERWIVGRR
jgi:hypothetical protein